MSQPAPDVDRQTLERVELALPEWAGGFEVLERNLKFDGKQVAHWLAYSQGRILLVSVVNGHSDGAVLRAMDGLSFAQNQPEMLCASLGEIEDDDALVQIVLVALEGYSKLQLERLGTLPAERLELLRRRELSTSRGTHTRMEGVECTEGGRSGPPVSLPDWSLEPEFRTFLARIAPDRLQLALTVVERMRRMDPQFGWQPEGTGLACSLDGKRLARLNWEAGHMQLTFDEDSPVLPIRDLASLEASLEIVLERYLDLLSGGRSRGRLLVASEPTDEQPSATENRADFSFDAKPWSTPYREPTSTAPGSDASSLERRGQPSNSPPVDPQERSIDFHKPGPRPGGALTGRGQDAFSPESLAADLDGLERPAEKRRSSETQESAREPELPAPAPAEEANLGELPELDDVEIQPLPPGPLLTAEEIDAFLE